MSLSVTVVFSGKRPRGTFAVSALEKAARLRVDVPLVLEACKVMCDDATRISGVVEVDFDCQTINRFTDLVKATNGRWYVSVEWLDGDKTSEPLQHVMHCTDTIRRLYQWALADCPSGGVRGKRISREIGARPITVNEKLRIVPDQYPFHASGANYGMCMTEAYCNLLARMLLTPSTDTTSDMGVPTPAQLRALCQRDKLVTMVKYTMSDNNRAYQDLTCSGEIYLAIAVPVGKSYDLKHAVVIDCRVPRKPVLIDSLNLGPVHYDKDSVKWVKSWSKMYKVTRVLK